MLSDNVNLTKVVIHSKIWKRLGWVPTPVSSKSHHENYVYTDVIHYWIIKDLLLRPWVNYIALKADNCFISACLLHVFKTIYTCIYIYHVWFLLFLM